MPNQKGFAHLLLIIPAVLIALILIVIPILVSKFMLPEVKKEFAAEFPQR